MNSSINQGNVCETCEFDKNLELLRNLSVFAALPLESQRAYAYLCRRVRYQPGNALFRQNDMDDKAYIVISGSLSLFRESSDDSADITESAHGTVETGQFFGGLALIADIRRLFTARAAEPTVCLVLPRKKLFTDLMQRPEIASQFMQGIANRVVTWEEKRLQQRENTDFHDATISISLL